MYKNIPFKIIAAVDKNLGIGFDNELLFHDKVDMNHFKATTTHNIVIMGRMTYESMGCVPLPNRINIVVTREKNVYEYHEPHEGVIYANSFDKAMRIASALRFRRRGMYARDIFVIGGGMLYATAIDYADQIILTVIDKAFKNVDSYFPKIDSDDYVMQCMRILNGELKLEYYTRISN